MSIVGFALNAPEQPEDAVYWLFTYNFSYHRNAPGYFCNEKLRNIREQSQRDKSNYKKNQLKIEFYFLDQAGKHIRF